MKPQDIPNFDSDCVDENGMYFAACLLDSARGVYIPQHFAESFPALFGDGAPPAGCKVLTAGSQDDRQTLLAGPDGEWYWEAWATVLDAVAWRENGVEYHLYQDGDLFQVVYLDDDSQQA